MDNALKKKIYLRDKRRKRVRKALRGTSEQPRLCVLKTNFHIYAQIIDDETGKVLGSVSTLAKDFRNTEFNRKNCKSAEKIGIRIAEIAKEKNIERVIFDRGKAKYHGILAKLADGARFAGLKV